MWKLIPSDGGLPTIPGQRERKDASFHCRLDRHGNPFGPRLETKQTRNPPPEYNNLMGEENPNPSRRMRDENPLGRQTTSPQYVHNREKMEPRQGKSRALTQNNKMSVWREKPDRGAGPHPHNGRGPDRNTGSYTPVHQLRGPKRKCSKEAESYPE